MSIGTLESCWQGTKKANVTPTPKASKKAVTLEKKRVDDEEGQESKDEEDEESAEESDEEDDGFTVQR